VLVLPEDVLAETADIGPNPGVGSPSRQGPADGSATAQPDLLRLTACAPSPETVTEIAGLLARAQRPLLIGGGLLTSPTAREALHQTAEQHVLPVVVSNKHQDLFDNNHPLYAGHLHIATQSAQRALLAESDLLLTVGTRLDAITTQGHTFPRAPVPAQNVVQVYPDPAQLGRVCQPAYALPCEAEAFLRALSAHHGPGPDLEARWKWAGRLHEAEVRSAAWQAHEAADGLPFGAVVSALNELTEPDAVITVDAGNFSSWLHRYYRFSSQGTLLGLGCGAMGFGVPSGLAAALRLPSRQVVTVVGDGGFLMTGTELATAVQRRARLVIVIADNGSYGTIRQHQERSYPGRVVATDLHNPDFAALARAFGAQGIAVDKERDLVPGLREALEHDGPSVVSVRTSLSWISAYQQLPPGGVEASRNALSSVLQV
jgi:acetolactate synthase-1/2/3 large subunit